MLKTHLHNQKEVINARPAAASQKHDKAKERQIIKIIAVLEHFQNGFGTVWKHLLTTCESQGRVLEFSAVGWKENDKI